MQRNWEQPILRSPQTRDLVTGATAEITAYAIKGAPRRSPTKDNWNQLKKNIHAYVEVDTHGWRGNVVTEDESHVRHAIRQELGWKDRKGRRHPGRRFLKAALLKARIE
ncbi:hypothetical protein FGW37_05370 [Streptomyces rectiverticillatus]|uniref:hypothetical protein n=1 Tax=Streptomyces rectiverticillatus TaxID=173860 RepID=UPI0015C36983|nr:hypothetical protein [Streptomyces rectiverticillatus]QLE71108.1 hypothetical protein FGW37_05370 [Streptomyces rectiverticillatus]